MRLLKTQNLKKEAIFPMEKTLAFFCIMAHEKQPGTFY